MEHVFISYAHEDGDFAMVLRHKLESENFTIWTDDNISAGEKWSIAIDDAIRSAFSLIVIISSSSKLSEYVTYEWSFALGLGIHVIPILLNEVDPHPKLRELQILNFTSLKLRPWEELTKKLHEIERSTLVPWRDVLKDVPREIKPILAALDSFRSDERIAAVERLAKMPFPTVDILATIVSRHPMLDARILSAFRVAELSNFEDERAISGLIETMGLINSREAEVASNMLLKYGRKAILAIADLLKAEDWRVRNHAIELFVEIDDVEAVPHLIDFLHQVKRNTSKFGHDINNAIEALQHFGTVEALAAVEQWQKEQGSGGFEREDH